MNTDFDVSAYLADRKRPIKDVMDIMKVGSGRPCASRGCCGMF